MASFDNRQARVSYVSWFTKVFGDVINISLGLAQTSAALEGSKDAKIKPRWELQTEIEMETL